MPTVLRALPPDYVDLFSKKNTTHQQQAFLNMMVESAHAHYCVMYGVNFLYKLDPDIAEIPRVLMIASGAKAEAADYFLMLHDAFAEKGEKIKEAISTFTTFFKVKKLRELWLCLYLWRVPFWMRSSPF